MQSQKCAHECEQILRNFKNLRDQYLPVLESFNLQDGFLLELEQIIQKYIEAFLSAQWDNIRCIDLFKRQQQDSIISGILDISPLDYIEQCNSSIFQFHMLVIDDLNKVLSSGPVQASSTFQTKFLNLFNQLNELLHILMQHVLLIVEQPYSNILKSDPLTIITNAKFEMSCTLLLDHQLIMKAQSYHKGPQMDLLLLKEDEIGIVLREGLPTILKQKPSFNIIYKAEPKYEVQNRRLTISVVCMLKVDINRRGHNPKGLPVAEEKFKFIFFTKLFLLKHEYMPHIFSLPVNVLSRKDYRNSYATIIWDCAFAIEGRQMFEVRDAVTWPELAAVINAKFRKDVGVDLRDEHLVFIATMIPNRGEANVVTWEQFAKQMLPQREFTFFEWFYKILILVREQLLQMYCDGLIHGFISSELAQSLLLNCVDGTFLLRFSETYCGAITIAYVKNRKFNKFFPWDIDRLRKISLPHTIKCCDFLLYLYANVPKDDVFCKFYIRNETQRSITGTDYKLDTNIAQILSTNHTIT